MGQKSARELLNSEESDRGKECATMQTNGSQRGTFFGYNSLPDNLQHIVADYISLDKNDPTRRGLPVKQRITLCLSQYANVELGSCWHFGCLSPEDQWETSMKVKIDEQYLVKDYENCLNFLGRENSFFCPVALEVLVFQLDMSSQDFPSALDDLERTLVVLQEHLNGVQHVVFAIEKLAFCCFSFKDVIDNVTRLRQAVDRLFALKQILSDLRICWTTNQTLSTGLLLDYYILNDDKPKSEVYLAKFVISLKHRHNRDLLDAVGPTLKSNKLKWLYCLETVDEVKDFDQRIASRCHAFYLDTTKIDGWNNPLNSLPPAYGFEENCFIERIVINTGDGGPAVQLPQPSSPLTDATLRSALIELTLKGRGNDLHLTHFNNDFFPHLTHLCIIGGKITGHLDSHHVPRLRRLIIETGSEFHQSVSSVKPLVREHIQCLISADRPWQLVATQVYSGWSLASYDEPTTNPQDEVKDDAVQSRPLIRELMLVMDLQCHAKEWGLRLNGNPPSKAAADDQNDGLLVWAPDRVQKITAFCTSREQPRLEFKEEIPGQTRILSSLAYHNVKVQIDGIALPRLQSLKGNYGFVTLSGAFPDLRTLSFRKTRLMSPYQLDAPLLGSLYCDPLISGYDLSLNPLLLPHLSFLEITPWGGDPVQCPKILINETSLRLSHVKHIVFGKEMTRVPFFEECQVQNMPCLELAVDAWKLPKCWRNTVWQCETLILNIYKYKFAPKRLFERDIIFIKTPPLPLVKKLTVTEGESCRVLLDSKMPKLIECTVSSPRMLGRNLKCPALQRIRFTDELSKSDREKYSNPTTYEAFGARPRDVIFAFHYEFHAMT